MLWLQNSLSRELTEHQGEDGIANPSYFFFSRFYLFVRERARASTGRQSGRQSQTEKQAPCGARSLMWDSIPGRWDHDLSRRQLFNQLSHPGVPPSYF